MANKKRVMIVDDDPDILISIKQILEAEGYKVYTFDNGEDCLKELDEGKKPTLIILDVMMPTMSGWEIHRKLGERSSWRKIPVIFLTARINETAEEMYKRYGVAHIKKPFDIVEFKERIENILFNKQKYSKAMCKCYY
jgi:DNA-binding response OmpR family regulator